MKRKRRQDREIERLRERCQELERELLERDIEDMRSYEWIQKRTQLGLV